MTPPNNGNSNGNKGASGPARAFTPTHQIGLNIDLTDAEKTAILYEPKCLRVSIVDLLVAPKCYDKAEDKARKLSNSERVIRGLKLLTKLEAFFDDFARRYEHVRREDPALDEQHRMTAELSEGYRRIIREHGGGTEGFMDITAVLMFADEMLVQTSREENGGFLCAQHETISYLAEMISDERKGITPEPVPDAPAVPMPPAPGIES